MFIELNFQRAEGLWVWSSGSSKSFQCLNRKTVPFPSVRLDVYFLSVTAIYIYIPVQVYIHTRIRPRKRRTEIWPLLALHVLREPFITGRTGRFIWKHMETVGVQPGAAACPNMGCSLWTQTGAAGAGLGAPCWGWGFAPARHQVAKGWVGLGSPATTTLCQILPCG